MDSNKQVTRDYNDAAQLLNWFIWRGWRCYDDDDDDDDNDDDDDDDYSEDNIDDHIEDIKADTASIPYISIVFAKRHGGTEGRTDGRRDEQTDKASYRDA